MNISAASNEYFKLSKTIANKTKEKCELLSSHFVAIVWFRFLRRPTNQTLQCEWESLERSVYFKE